MSQQFSYRNLVVDHNCLKDEAGKLNMDQRCQYDWTRYDEKEFTGLWCNLASLLNAQLRCIHLG